MKPTIGDWFTWFACLLFTAMGIWLCFVEKDISIPIMCVAFFGVGFVGFTKSIADKYRQNRLFDQENMMQKLPLDYPLYMSKGKFFVIFSVLILLGAIIAAVAYATTPLGFNCLRCCDAFYWIFWVYSKLIWRHRQSIPGVN